MGGTSRAGKFTSFACTRDSVLISLDGRLAVGPLTARMHMTVPIAVPDSQDLLNVVRVEQMLRQYTGQRLPEATIGRIARTELGPAVQECRAWLSAIVNNRLREVPEWARRLHDALLPTDAITLRSVDANPIAVRDAVAAAMSAVRNVAPDPGVTPYDHDAMDELREEALARFPALLKTALAAQLNVLDMPPASPEDRARAGTNAPIGARVYASLGLARPNVLQRFLSERATHHPGALDVSMDTTIAPLVGLARAVVHNVTQEMARGNDGRLLLWVEAHLPDARAIRPADAMWQHFDDLEHLGAVVERILLEERRYARTIGLGPARYDGIQRAPITDVVMAVAFQRILNHADPFTVWKESMIATRGQGERVIARAIELALVRRIDELLGDKPDPASKERRPVGWEIEPMRRRLLLDAFNQNRLPAELRRTGKIFGERDPEYQRIAHAATRFYESGMVLHAVSEFRPIGSGMPAASATLKWPRALVVAAEHALRETEGRGAAMNSDGAKMPWTALVERHPQFKAPEIKAVSWLVQTPPVLAANESPTII
jgi:hypothetical protein